MTPSPDQSNPTGLGTLVLRKIAQIFPRDRRQWADSRLRSYGRGPHQREPDRVRLAILKLTDEAGMDSLERHLAVAKMDYRDVLAAAEYPGQMRAGATVAVGSSERARLAQSDLEQYLRWLVDESGSGVDSD